MVTCVSNFVIATDAEEIKNGIIGEGWRDGERGESAQLTNRYCCGTPLIPAKEKLIIIRYSTSCYIMEENLRSRAYT